MKSKLVEKNVLYNARSMFELVSDVEKYPLFVPACKSLKIINKYEKEEITYIDATCLLYTSPSPRDGLLSRMPSSA